MYILPEWIHQDKQIWQNLSMQPRAVYILEKNPDKINWNLLSLNHKAMHLLEKNQDKISWY